VIIDSCHSGGISRTDEMGARTVPSTSLLPEDLDKDIWMWSLPRTTIPAAFLDPTMSSHVLLAACRSDEVAFEDLSAGNRVRGAFTRNLLNILYRERDLTRITYSALIDMLPPLERQHPQCNGKNRGRALFGEAVADKTFIKLLSHGGKYRAEAGEIHGVVKGTLFSIHAFGDITSTSSEIGILEADTVSHFSCTLRWRSENEDFDIPPGARATVLKW